MKTLGQKNWKVIQNEAVCAACCIKISIGISSK